MLEQIANISEIVGTVIVVVTIVFLILQIRQSTVATQTATTLNLTTRMAENYRTLALSREITSYVSIGFSDPQKLDAEDLSRFTAWMIHVFLNFQDFHFQAQSKAFDKLQYEGFMRLFAHLAKSPGFTLVWNDRKFMFSEDFQKFVENDLKNFYTEESFQPFSVNSESIE